MNTSSSFIDFSGQCGIIPCWLRRITGMGSCLCKEKKRHRGEQDIRLPAGNSCRDHPYRPPTIGEIRAISNGHGHVPQYGNDYCVYSYCRDLISQTLRIIRTLVNNDQEPPAALLKLNAIAEKEQGWLIVVRAMIDLVPDNDSLGPAVISLFLDECPLPSKEWVHKLLHHLDLGSTDSSKQKSKPGWNKNACIVLSSLAEKLAGANCLGICNDKVLNYLVQNLDPKKPKQVILFSLIALEKFALTNENQNLIMRCFDSSPIHPLERLEKWFEDKTLQRDFLGQQVAFCAQWSLDNIFVKSDRIFAYESVDVSNINAMLNHEDVSEYLKIGPDGLEARCDVSSFESVRCTFEVLEGVWYYEATVLTPGVMQIGFATKRSRFLNHEGYGIGDDESSVAYDGCRQLLWHNANSEKHEHPTWSPGDVVGCLLNIPCEEVLFFLNGVPLQHAHTEFLSRRPSSDGVFAAASFMSFQQCRFNFGATPFAFPPAISFRSFNQAGEALSLEQKTILPRRRKLELLRNQPIPDDSCTICYANPGDHVLLPCGHTGFCGDCALQVEKCPLCRAAIGRRRRVSPSLSSLLLNGSERIETVL